MEGPERRVSVNDVVSAYQIIRRTNQFPLCRTAELWEKNHNEFQTDFPLSKHHQQCWVCSRTNSQSVSLPRPSHQPKHTLTRKLKNPVPLHTARPSAHPPRFIYIVKRLRACFTLSHDVPILYDVISSVPFCIERRDALGRECQWNGIERWSVHNQHCPSLMKIHYD